jgi:hypothetical protein
MGGSHEMPGFAVALEATAAALAPGRIEEQKA